MKIIRHGKRPEEKKPTVRRFKCTKCGCVFEAGQGEYAHYAETDFTFHGITLHVEHISKCPECGARANEAAGL